LWISGAHSASVNCSMLAHLHCGWAEMLDAGHPAEVKNPILWRTTLD
jgi:hypothetical protein